MLTSFCFGFYLALVLQVKCNNLYVDPQTEYITGGKIAVSCISIFDGPVTTGNAIEWIEMKSLSIISNHPESRVRRDGHRLLFDSTKYSDKGLYCCRLSKRSPSPNHGCTYNSTVKIMAIESRTVTAAPQHSDARHNVVIKSTTTGTWHECFQRSLILATWLHIASCIGQTFLDIRSYLHLLDINFGSYTVIIRVCM